MSEKASFSRLASAIENTFSDRKQTENFLRMLEQTGTKLWDFDRALGELPGPGGAFGAARRLPIKSCEMYGRLESAEQARLKKIYLDKALQLEAHDPELRRSYFVVFDR
jgi:hypothetical protein